MGWEEGKLVGNKVVGDMVGASVQRVGLPVGTFVVGNVLGDLVRVGRLVVFGALVVGFVGRLVGLRVSGGGKPNDCATILLISVVPLYGARHGFIFTYAPFFNSDGCSTGAFRSGSQ